MKGMVTAANVTFPTISPALERFVMIFASPVSLSLVYKTNVKESKAKGICCPQLWGGFDGMRGGAEEGLRVTGFQDRFAGSCGDAHGILDEQHTDGRTTPTQHLQRLRYYALSPQNCSTTVIATWVPREGRFTRPRPRGR